MAEKYVRKEYSRISGCLSLKDADKLWMDLAAYRRATGSKTMYARQKYGRGWAIFEVIEQVDHTAICESL